VGEEGMTLTMAPICVACKHFEGWTPGTFGGRCRAFPSGIPRTILLSDIDHRKAYHGDQGVIFAAKSIADAGYPNVVFGGPGGKSQPLSQTILAPLTSTVSSENKPGSH
jgi:hypothetical protein